MANKQITQGEIKRTGDQLSYKQEALTKKIDQLQKKLEEKQLNFKKGEFKNSVIKAFLEQFGTNYGDILDYYSLIESINVSFKKGPHNEIVPEISFNENHVIFKSDAQEMGVRFNQNSYDDFVSNNDEINGKEINRNFLKNNDEEIGYEAEEQRSSDTDNIQSGQFIPTTKNDERYGGFNKINKTNGYTPPNESAKKAIKIAMKTWKGE